MHFAKNLLILSCVISASTGYGECLLDEPVGRSYDLPVKLPGQIYNANRQCELMFGPGSQVCPFMVSPEHVKKLSIGSVM